MQGARGSAAVAESICAEVALTRRLFGELTSVLSGTFDGKNPLYSGIQTSKPRSRCDAAAGLPPWRRARVPFFSELSLPIDPANFRGLVLGCIETKFCK